MYVQVCCILLFMWYNLLSVHNYERKPMPKKIIINTLPFQEYSFDSVFTALQPYLKDGFQFDLESNEHYPKTFGTVYTFAVQEYRTEEVLIEPEVVAEVITEKVPEVAPEPKTRRAKNQG